MPLFQYVLATSKSMISFFEASFAVQNFDFTNLFSIYLLTSVIFICFVIISFYSVMKRTLFVLYSA